MTHPGVLVFWSRRTYHCPPRPSRPQTRGWAWKENSRNQDSETNSCTLPLNIFCNILYFVNCPLWWAGKNKSIVNVNQMTLTVEKDIAIVSVLDLLKNVIKSRDKRSLEPVTSRRRCSKRRNSWRSSSAPWGTPQSWAGRTPGLRDEHLAENEGEIGVLNKN